MPDTMPWQDYGNSQPQEGAMPWMDFQQQPAQQQAPSLTGTLADIFKSGGAQAAKDVAQVPMWLADTANAATQGVTRLAGEGKEALANMGIGNHLTLEQAQELTNPKLPFAGSQDVINAAQPAIKEATGADINYHPQTKAGEYTAGIVGAVPYAVNPEMSLPKAIGMGIGQQGGKDLASLFTNDPRYQQVAGILGGAGGMMAGEPVVAGAKYIAENDIGKNLPSILGDASSGGTPAAPKASSALPTYDPAEIKAAAEAAYANSEKMGGQLPIDNMRQAVGSILNNKDVGQQTARGQAFAGDNPVTQTMEKLQAAVKTDEPWTTADANEIDDALRNDITKARSSGDYDSARRLGIIKNTLRDTYKTYAEANPQQAAGFNEWIRGDKLYSAAMNGQEISDIIENAQRADVPSTAIKNGFKSFVKNDDNKIGLTDDEWEAAQYAAKHGILTQGLKNVGSRLAGHIGGIVGGAHVAGPLGAVAGDMVGQAVTAPFRAWANARQADRGQNVVDLISQRPVVQEALDPNFKLPTSQPATATMTQAAAQPVPNPKYVNPLSQRTPQGTQSQTSQPVLAAPMPGTVKQIPVMPLRESTPSEQALDKIYQDRITAGVPAQATLESVLPATEKTTQSIKFKEPNEKGVLPTSFKTFIMQPKIGGIKDFQGEVKEVAPGLVAKGNKGLSIDDALTYAKERDYMPEDATQADFLTKLKESDSGKGIYRAKDLNRVQALQESRAAKQQNDPARIESEAAGMGIDTTGKSTNDLLDEMSARQAHEASLRDYVSQYKAHEDELAAQDKAHQEWLKTRGEAWEPSPEPKIRTLEDLENGYEQEKASGRMASREQSPETPISASSNKGGIPKGEAARGSSAGNTQENGNGAVNPLLEFLKNEEGSISPKVYEELLNQIQKNAPAFAISGNAVLNNGQQNNAISQQPAISAKPSPAPVKEPVNTSMRDQLMQAFAKAESGNNPNAKNPNSSASGLMQFTDDTWKQMVKRYGADTGIGLQDKSDPKAQQVMAALYARDNVNRMQPFLKRNPTKGELYQAHVLGADGALRLINAANEQPNKQAIMLFPKAVTMANKPIFFQDDKPRTAAQVYALLASKV